MQDAMYSSKKDDWQTPDLVRNIVYSFADGKDKVDDPCPGENPVGIPLTGDGLSRIWPTDKTLFVNPPYGKVVGQWTRKCAQAASAGSEVLCLIAARTDTQWFHDALQSCTSLLLVKGRLKFKGAKYSAPFPSAIFYWGERKDRFEEYFSCLGYSLDTE